MLAVLIATQKRMQNNDIFKTMNMKRSDVSPSVYSLFQHSQPTVHDFTFQCLRLVNA